MRIRVTLDIRLVGEVLRSTGKRYITVKQVSRMLGVSTRTAGKIMARLEEIGYARRFSERTYELLDSSSRAVASEGIPQSTPMKRYLARPR